MQTFLHNLKIFAPTFLIGYGLLKIHPGLFWVGSGLLLIIMFW